MIDLRLDHVSKRYRVRHHDVAQRTGGALRKALRRLRPRRMKEFWAVRDVSFEVGRGETLGIIGHNGAGKSTILKLLSSVTAPTSGEITIIGRLSALIEVGSGFHPELTGLENVYLSGSILGMRRREITDKLERIVEFAGVREFIDSPVKHYSSGMYVRLGFSIAAHLEPDILLLDEVLSVGDAAFQVKCLDRINELHREGRTIVFISHDLASVERLCGRVLLLHRGQIVAGGPPRDVITTYQEVGSQYATADERPPDVVLTREAEITSVTCWAADGRPATTLRTGAATKIRVDYVAHESVPDAVIEVYWLAVNGGAYLPWCQLTTASTAGSGVPLHTGSGAVEFDVDPVTLAPGMYYLSVNITNNRPPRNAIDLQMRALTLRVDEGQPVRGSFYMPHRWRQLTHAPAADVRSCHQPRSES
jgi:ABC-type polysaccharide/polyol phosphate transport system ATPase subunit